MTSPGCTFTPTSPKAQQGAVDNRGCKHFSLIVIGTGLAGYTLAREYRKLDAVSSLMLISRDDAAYYSKPLLSNGLAKNKSAADLSAQGAQAMSDNLDAFIANHTEVSEVDTSQKRLVTQDQSYSYDKLVFATGALQIKLPIEGDAVEDVISVNDLGEYAEFRQRLEGIERVAVMGPGLIGCEFANDLASIDKTTVIIGPDKHPLERLLPEPVGRALQKGLSELGVEWHLGTFVKNLSFSSVENSRGTSRQYQLTLENGDRVEAGLVLSAAGLKPDLALARLAGLKTESGIVVDAQLQSSASDVYAIGDCAEVEGLVLPYVMPIMFAAKTLAHNLAIAGTQDDIGCKSVAYPGMPVVVKTPAYPLVIASPAPGLAGVWLVEEVEGGIRALYQSADDQLLGFVLSGSCVTEKARLGKQLPALL